MPGPYGVMEDKVAISGRLRGGVKTPPYRATHTFVIKRMSFQHSCSLVVENSCNLYLIIIV